MVIRAVGEVSPHGIPRKLHKTTVQNVSSVFCNVVSSSCEQIPVAIHAPKSNPKPLGSRRERPHPKPHPRTPQKKQPPQGPLLPFPLYHTNISCYTEPNGSARLQAVSLPNSTGFLSEYWIEGGLHDSGNYRCCGNLYHQHSQYYFCRSFVP